jgi:FKBP-type peptidyl-prolyl cis-trans isomerase
VKGLTTGLKGEKPEVSEERLKAAIAALQTQLQEQAEAREEARFKLLEEKRTEQAEANKKEGAEFLAKNKDAEGVKTTKSGLQYKVLKAGKGAVSPKATDTVKTHYKGTLIDGTEFDSSLDGEPVSFPVNGVIKGWTEALQLMKVGDKYQLFIPSELAYGARGQGRDIGPNAVLIFEVELLGIEKGE